MARKEVVELTDDLDQSPASQTIQFAIDGVEYEIDLSEKNAKKFNSALAPYVERAGGSPAAGAWAGGGLTPRRVSTRKSFANGRTSRGSASAHEAGFLARSSTVTSFLSAADGRRQAYPSGVTAGLRRPSPLRAVRWHHPKRSAGG